MAGSRGVAEQNRAAPKQPPAAAKPISYGNPVDAPVGSGYGVRVHPISHTTKMHNGLDFPAAYGEPVLAVSSGRVSYAGTKGGFGNHVRIEHNDGLGSSYSHLSSILVSKGQQVNKGDLIGRVGSTGQSTGNHLHLEIYDKNGKPINPSDVLDGKFPPETRHAHKAPDKHGSSSSPGSSTGGAKLTPKNQNSGYYSQFSEEDLINALTTGEHYLPNPLNEYENITYHWKFFMMTDIDLIGPDEVGINLADFQRKIERQKQVIIAETGMTQYNIASVTAESVVGTDYVSRSTKFTEMEMKIIEPNGVRFLDSLRHAAEEAGIRNYHKCFYYLELTFKGYDSEGNAIEGDPFGGLIPNGGRWLWSVIISNIDVNLDAGGGTYNLKLMPMNDTAVTDKYGILPAAVYCKGNTLGEMLVNLSEQLNAGWISFVFGAAGVITHDFQIHGVGDNSTDDFMSPEQVAAMPFSTDASESRAENMDLFLSNGVPAGQYNTGTRIQDIINSLLSSCETAQEMAWNTNHNGTHPERVTWMLEPEVRITGYDGLTNDYRRRITWHLFGFRHHTTIVSPEEVEAMKSLNAQKALMASLAKRGFIRKRYDYIFTGQNTEIIDIDLNFNLAWAAVLPFIESTSYEQQPDTLAKVSDGENEKNRKFRPSMPLSEQLENYNAINRDVQEAQERVYEIAREANKISKDPSLSQEEKNKQVEELLKEQNQKDAVLQKTRKELIPYSRALGGREDRNIAAYADVVTDASRSFAEDIPLDYDSDPNVSRISFEKSQNQPVNFNTDGSQGQVHNGKSIYGAVLNQAYGVMETQFANIRMSVRGDPFWVPHGSFEEDIYRRSGQYPVEKKGFFDFSHGANVIMFRFKYPLGMDDNNQVILNADESVTGVYQVNTITHKWEGGQFTQTLNANRLQLVDVYQALTGQKDTEALPYYKSFGDLNASIEEEKQKRKEVKDNRPVVSDRADGRTRGLGGLE